MKCLFELSKENIPLASDEIACLLLIRNSRMLSPNFLLGDTNKESMVVRLALTRHSYEVLFYCKNQKLRPYAKKMDWNKLIRGSYSITLQCPDNSFADKGYLKAELQRIVHASLENPKVNLRTPSQSLVFLVFDDNTFCCRLIRHPSANFESRRPHKRPGFAPVSLDPKLARACVNLLGPKASTIVDPMCGTGGFLIEAGLMNLNTLGSDICKKMLSKCKTNLEHFGIMGFDLRLADFFLARKTISHLITDLPYGRNTNIKDEKLFYSSFFNKLEKVLTHTAVVLVPNTADIKYLQNSRTLKIIKEYSVYIHKTLTKRILLIKKSNA